MQSNQLNEADIDRVVEMAWEDRTPFEAIFAQFGLTEAEVITLMRRQLKPASWRMWRQRVAGRATKHAHKRPDEVTRFRADRQRVVSRNKISKRHS